MAGTYTNSASGAGMRYGMHAYIKVVVTDTSNTVCRVRVECWAVSDGGYSGFIDGRCSAYAGGSYGSWTGHDQDVTAGGSTLLNYAEFNVDRESSNKTVTYWAQIRGTSTSSSNYYYGCSESVSVNATIPKISTEKPNAPTDCSAAYVSDTSVSVSWTNGSTTTTKPRTATLVERSTDGGAWVQIASAGSSATSYADNGVSANHSYAYRVCASNSAGKSAYSTAGTVYTTPAAPSSIVLSKTAQTTVQVDVEGAAPYATAYRVELTHDGGSTWEVVEASTSLPITVDVGGGTAQFRVASLNGALQSAWTLSESIVTITPPLAPTIVQQPSNPTALGGACIIAWTPNHPDGTAQTAAQVKLTIPSGTTSTVDLTTAKTYSFTPTITGTYSMQVRTKGLDADWGEWSNLVGFGVYNPPAVVIDSPASDGAEVDALPLIVSWSVTDSTGVSAQRVVVSDSSGTQIYNKTQAASVRFVELTDSDVALQDSAEYSITVRVMGGSGLITEVVRTFAVNWAPPAAPRLDVAEGEGASAQIVVDNPTTSASGTVVEAESSRLASLTIHGKSVQDGTPSPSSPVPIRSVESRNLLDTSISQTTIARVTYTNSSDGSVVLNGTKYGGSYADIKSGIGLLLLAGTYRFNAQLVSGTATHAPTVYLLDSSSTSIAGISPNMAGALASTTITVTEPKTVAVLRFALWTDNSVYTDATYRVWLESGSATHDYQPYGYITLVTGSERTPIDLQGNALRSLPSGTEDTLEVDGEGNVTLTKRVGSVTLDGTEDWTVVSGRNYGTYTGLAGTIQTPPTTTTPTNSYCNLVSPVQAQNASVTPNIYITEGIAVGSTGNVLLNLVGNAGGTTVDALKAALAATPAEFLYPLASPQTVQLGRIEMPYIDGTMHIDAAVTPTIDASFIPVESEDTPLTESVTVQRVNADGTTWTVAASLPLGGTCIDPLPPLGVEVVYIATASAASGATASERYTATIGGRTWALNAGAAAQEHMELRYNPQASYAMEHGGESYHFADGGAGGGRPVFYPTTDRDESGALKFATIGKDDADRLRALCDKYPVAWLRDPFGHRWRAHVKPSWSHGVGQLWPIGIDWDAVRWTEAWDG